MPLVSLMQLRAAEIANLVGGTLHGPDVEVAGASADSRELVAGQLFVPVVAERDGHQFIDQAVGAGASAYLTSGATSTGASAIEVADTVDALAELARRLRDRMPPRVIGVTGSVGKTTVKDLLAEILRTTFVTAASVRSHNNELGVPLTLVNAPEGTEAAVVEMGARGLGHIRHLSTIARPTVGIVTTVGLAHSEHFGGLDRISEAKGELVEMLPSSGTAVLNADVAEVIAMATRTAAHVVTFGVVERADVIASDVRLDDDLRPSFRLESPWGSADVRLAVRGHHQVSNALAAAAGALAVGVPIEAVAPGLARAELSPWRMDLRRSSSGARVLNDAYNANPISMRSALRSLAALPADRRRAVLGLMAELGPDEDDAHREIAHLADELGIEVIAVAAPAYGPGAHHVDDIESAARLLEPLGADDAVLVKGSRVAGLERLVALLVDD